MTKVVIYYEDDSGLQPISFYLHPALWIIGNKELNDGRAENNRSLLEWVLLLHHYHGMSDFSIVGKKQVNQLMAHKQLFELDLGADIELLASDELGLLEQINSLENEDTLLYNGYVLTNADLGKFREFAHSHNKVATLLISEGLQYRVGLAKVDRNGVITEFMEKPYDRSLSSFTGILHLKEGWKEYLQEFMNQQKVGERSTLNSFIKYLIEEREVKVQIKQPPGGQESWWIDMSMQETWIKLDVNGLMSKMSYLLK